MRLSRGVHANLSSTISALTLRLRCIGESSSGQVFAEKTLSDPGWKHIEIQVIGDGTGAVNHLWERECSVQRRYAHYSTGRALTSLPHFPDSRR